MSDEIYRVLDPDPPKRQGVNQASRSAKEKPESVTKSRLIQATEKEFKKISEARSSESESEGESESESESEGEIESHKGSDVVERQEPQWGYSFERNCVLRRWESETLK